MLFCSAATRQAQELVHRAHPGGVAAGQIVVDRHQVDAAAGQGVEIHGHGGHEGLAFAGLHLGDGALVQHHRPHHLHVERAHAGGPLGGLAGDREGLGHEIVERLPLGEPFLELAGLRREARSRRAPTSAGSRAATLATASSSSLSFFPSPKRSILSTTLIMKKPCLLWSRAPRPSSMAAPAEGRAAGESHSQVCASISP